MISTKNTASITQALKQVEAFLGELNTQERQEALEALRSMMEKYLESSSEKNVLSLFKKIGGPKILANQILLKNNKKLIPLGLERLHATAIMMLGLALAFILFLTYAIYRFTPIVSVKPERIQLLGGTIDIDSRLGSFKFGSDFEFRESEYENIFDGSLDIEESLEDLSIQFERGQLDIETAEDGKFTWKCKLESEPNDQFFKNEKETLLINLVQYGGGQCVFKVPTQLKLTINGSSGKVDLIDLANDTYVQLANGLVSLSLNPELKYRLDTKVSNGSVDPTFKNLKDEGGIEIKVDLGNGRIQKR